MSLSWRRIPALLAALMASLAALVLVLLLVAIALELSIDASRWRGLAEQRASDALGRPVSLQGVFELRLGREFGIHIGRLQIQNAAGFTQAELLTLSDASARFDLLEALRGRLILSSVEASAAELRLERASDGRDNWSPTVPRNAAQAPAAVDIRQFTLRRLAVHFQDLASTQQHALLLDELSGSAKADAPLQISLLGHADEQTPYKATLEAGPLAQLLQADEQPWPFKLALAMGSASLQADGLLEIRQGKAQFEFKAQAEQLATVAHLLKQPLPSASMPVSLQGRVAANSATVTISDLQGRLGDTELTGQAALTLGSGRPKLAATLNLATLDLQPWLAPTQSPATDLAPTQALALRNFVPAGIDLKLDGSVGRCSGLAFEVSDAEFELSSDGQAARLPFKATLAGVPLAGSLNLDLAPQTPKFALQVSASDVALGPLALALQAPGHLQGNLAQLDLQLSGQGETLDSLWPELEVSLAAGKAQLSYARSPGGRPFGFALDRLMLTAPRGERLRGQARGSMLGEQARLELRGGSLAELRRELAMPLELKLKLLPSQMSLQLGGRVALPAAQRENSLNFAFDAPRSGDLERWLGFDSASKLPVHLSGQVHFSADAVQLKQTRLKLGQSELRLDAHFAGLSNTPLTRIKAHSPLIDMGELSTLRAEPRASARAPRDAPLLSADAWPDLDLELELRRVIWARADLADLHDLALQARVRDGQLLPSTLAARMAGQPLKGQVEFDPRGERASLKLALSSSKLDLGALLRGLGAAEDVNGHVETLELRLQGSGNSPREFADQAELEARLTGGEISIIGAGRRPVTSITLAQATINAAGGQPLRLQLDGSVEQTPIKFELRTGSLADFTRKGAQLPLWMEAQAAGAQLQLEGQVALPLGRSGELSFEAGGERLDTLTQLFKVNLPPWGPWRLRGPIQMTADSYEFDRLRLRVGESQLGGTGKIDLSGPRPRLDLRVSGRSVQLADFPTPKIDDQADASHGSSDAPKGNAMVSLRAAVSGVAARTEGLLSAGFLRRFDANLDVVAREVFSGTDRLADGELHLTLKDGRLQMDPAFVNLPGGRMQLSATFDPTGADIEFAAKAAIERFDYGIIARRMGRQGNVQGLFSVNLDIAGRGPTLSTVLRDADGQVDIAVWPTNLRADVFNLWSVNLVLNLLPLIDPGGQPQVNCVVARFDLKDGRLSDDKLTIDTTRVRVRGSGFADLATEEISFLFRPRAKGFALFRLQTPLRVSGTLNNQRIGIQRGDLIGSTMRSIFSPIWLPIERLMLGPNPPDGADLCTDPLRLGGR